MKLYKSIIFTWIILFASYSCELLEPENDNHSIVDRIYDDPDFAEGLLMKAYINLPTNNLTFNDVATDDAVINDKFNVYLRMATGQWSAIFNPVSEWDNCNESILYLNRFLDVVDSVPWKWTDSEINELFIKRFKGEAYALRALFQYHLLVTTGGIGENNELLGIPIYDASFSDNSLFNQPRAGFFQTIDQIYSDIDQSLAYLTMDKYADINNLEDLPEGFKELSDVSKYNYVFGMDADQRMNGLFAKALKARVALLAASPAFSQGDAAHWEDAANYAADVINSIGGINAMDPKGHRFYEPEAIDAINLAKGKDQKEIILRTSMAETNTIELANFPPSLFGRGEVNPSQNLVDAFPMKNGFPIEHAESGYDPLNPYANRDPRFDLYIIYNGSKLKGKDIITAVGGGLDAKDSINNSTRTGYYLRKMLREDVNANPESRTTKKHYNTHMRFTELYLIYAEAANEAWGPDGSGQNGFSARDVISAIRIRAGITQPDHYLATVSGTDEMRTLIRNERRLELCFEGFRFWDLRRWKSDLTEPVKGIAISKNDDLSYVNVESRAYNNVYMHYGPLPKNEVLKFPGLIQNRGW